MLLRRWLVASLAVCVLLSARSSSAVVDDDQFRQDVVLCEAAVAHLEECCPSFDTGVIGCRYHYDQSEGCSTQSGSERDPSFDAGVSRDLLGMSCPDIAGSGLCTSASHQAPPFREW